MEDEKELNELQAQELLSEEKEHYVPRPWWQIALAWVLLILTVLGVISYYYWIMYRY